ncbi:MAG: hypothetical protein E2O61_07435 [Gammaproteobacteria bacterium]|nr:MAG: hypothetical protein E2O61_07435 [Gammaproteobacteria bacterium]
MIDRSKRSYAIFLLAPMVFEELSDVKDSLGHYRIVEEPAAMRHFTAKFELVGRESCPGD